MKRHPLVGQFLSSGNKYERIVDGTVVHFIRGGDQLTQDQMTQYAGIDSEHDSYRSVRGPAKIDRVVLDKGNGGYWIAPVHLFVGV